jgi:hypothetical protein
MLAISTPAFDPASRRKPPTVIMYLWTASGHDIASFRAAGVSDDQARARKAAEALLRTGKAGTAYIECAYTAMATSTLSLCYVRTGIGWQARLGQAGRVVWTPFTTVARDGQIAGMPIDSGRASDTAATAGEVFDNEPGGIR